MIPFLLPSLDDLENRGKTTASGATAWPLWLGVDFRSVLVVMSIEPNQFVQFSQIVYNRYQRLLMAIRLCIDISSVSWCIPFMLVVWLKSEGFQSGLLTEVI